MEIDAFKQGATKHCVFGVCKSDSRYGTTPFLPFPKPCLAVRRQLEKGDTKHLEECSLCAKSHLWILKCRREKFSKLTDVRKWHYICVLHFVDQNGPSPENPFPLPAAEATFRRVKQERTRRHTPASDARRKVGSTEYSKESE